MTDEPKTQAAAMPEDTPGSIFISYSRKDQRYLNELHTHLAHYVRKNAMVYWDDTKILPGSRWKEDLNNALRAAKIGLLLVSADFFASDFIFKREMGPLLEAARRKEVEILSVIVGFCPFEDSDLAQFQAMNDPIEPLKGMTQVKREEVWERTARRCRDILSQRKDHTHA